MSLSTYWYEPFFTASDFNGLFDAAWEARNTGSSRDVQRRDDRDSNVLMRPRMDLHEAKDKNEMTATFELPGMRKEDVSIDVHNNRLIVSGQSTLSDTLDSEGYALRERRFGKFTRNVPLPAGTKHEDIKARMEHGVLTVTFPKTHPEQEAKKIAIS